jgi:peptidoglycan-associated lipoprotein
MKNLQSKLLILVVFVSFGLIISSCAQKLDKEFSDANTELEKLRESGGDPEDIAEIEGMIAEAKELLAAGDRLGAQKKLEEARFKAIEARGRAELATLDEDRPLRSGEEMQIGLVPIFFDYDQSRVRADAAPVLGENARIIKNHMDQIKVVIIEGYCDTRGTDEYNLALGDKRAKSVAAYLAGIGVDVNVLESVSRGETDEWGSDATESAYQQNRRAHFKVIAKGDSMMTE